MLWMLIIAMTVGALVGVIWPLFMRPPVAAPERLDAAFYRAQIEAIDRDLAAGLIAAPDADAARAEAARRALAASAAVQPIMRAPKAAAALALAIALASPALTLPLYYRLGRPDLPDAPFADRLEQADARMDINALLARLERHIAAHPDDGKAQELAGPVYLRLDRPDDSVKAYAAALRLLGEAPARRAAYAEALVAQAQGVIAPAARAAFEQALTGDPQNPKAQFYLGVGAEQAGDKAKALDIWRRLLANSPPDAIWTEMVRSRIARLTDGAVPKPPPEAAQTVAGLPPGERDAFIRSMVDGLAGRLAENGQDVEGWLRLMRSLSVLHEGERAKTALADARRSLAADPAALARVNQAARELGIEGG